jgi:hypothetical protein
MIFFNVLRRPIMGIGGSVLLMALGAVLTFALDFKVAGVDIQVVGWILMVAGLVGLIFTVAVLMPRKRHTLSQTTGVTKDGPVDVTTEHVSN